jgi:hypothetical protein
MEFDNVTPPEGYQTYEVNVTFEYEGPIYDGDPDDRYILAQLERGDIERILLARFSECEIKSLVVNPVIAPGE